MNELIKFKEEKREAYIDHFLQGLPEMLNDDELPHVRGLLRDCFDAAFDFGRDSEYSIIDPVKQAEYDRDDRISTIRRTALELFKSDLVVSNIDDKAGDGLVGGIIRAAIYFEETLKQKVL